jgi:hypothetical protein
VQLASGDRVLFFPICDENCPSGPEPTPLEIQASATADVGEPTTVTVEQYNTKGEPSPAVGAEIAWTGASATTDSQGHATLRLGSAGIYKLRVTGAITGPPAVRTEANICVHNGNDGTCGTQTSTGPSAGPTSAGSTPTVAPYKGPYALVSHLTSVIDGHVYKRNHAPRVLAGAVLAHTTVTSISLTLRRSYRGRCYAFDGVLTRFVRARCGTGSSFKVSDNGLFSYLLPSALPPGRYVLDVEAIDAAGNHTTLARGTSRIVFYVR